MKKSLFRACLFVALALSAAFSASAQAQTLYGQSQFGAGLTVDLTHARKVDLTTGAQKVVDFQGVTINGAFPTSPTDFTGGSWFDGYVQVGNLYYNVTVMRSVTCSGSSTVVNWMSGVAETFSNDGCSLFTAIQARSRR